MTDVVLNMDEEKPTPTPNPEPVVPSPTPDLDPTPGSSVLIPEDPKAGVTPEKVHSTTDNPISIPIKTGDTTCVILPAVMVLVASIVGVFAYRRRKE